MSAIEADWLPSYLLARTMAALTDCNMALLEMPDIDRPDSPAWHAAAHTFIAAQLLARQLTFDETGEVEPSSDIGRDLATADLLSEFTVSNAAKAIAKLRAVPHNKIMLVLDAFVCMADAAGNAVLAIENMVEGQP